jgi:ribonuclease HII
VDSDVAKFIDPSFLDVGDLYGRYSPDAGSEGLFYIAGIDEAGRGALAGPVVAAAVILRDEVIIPNLNDSKSLTPLQRKIIYSIIFKDAVAVGLGIVSARIVDERNVLNATLLAMARALRGLEVIPQYVLVDGNRKIPVPVPQTAVVNGDRKIPAISAASIIAKVYRDAIMERLEEDYPEYGFGRHKGYATRNHKEALCRWGPTPYHRFTFRPVSEIANGFFT